MDFQWKTKLTVPSLMPAARPLAALCVGMILAGCNAQVKNGGVTSSTAGALPSTPAATPTATATVNSTGPNAVQILMSTGASGSFDATSVPLSGGTYAPALRFYDLSGNLVSNSAYTSWWIDSSNTGTGAYLTSTSTTYAGGGINATTSTSGSRYKTPCAYFDSYDDNNPESVGSYTIDGIVPNPPSLTDTTNMSDVDQCAGITLTERSKLGIFIKIRRAYMNSTDKLQLIIKARPLNQPNTAPVPSSCIVGGLFDATACATAVFTVTMRTSLTAAARPFYMLFPSSKSLDLISESVLLPVNIDSNITTITIDRLKGGAVFYSIILVRVP